MSTEPLRLDEAGALFPYVNATSAWVHRCAKRMLELDPTLDPLAAMQYRGLPSVCSMAE